MKLNQSVDFMDSLMSVKEGTQSSFGKHLLTCLTVFQLRQSLKTKFYVCMVAYLQS